MVFLFWIAVIVVVGVAIYFVTNQKRLASQRPVVEELPPLNRTLFTLQIGDIVQFEDRDWVVEGKLTYDDDGFVWLEYMVQDGDDIRWLSVSEDDTIEVSWLESIADDLEISGKPPKTLEYGGETFTRVESGKANMSRMGTIQKRKAESCRYYDYEGDGDRVLSVENWDGDIEVSVGYSIRPSQLSLLPGGGGSVYRSM
ncbi:DUF4178 domain-containing protein [Baaleninema simplex]|uniref:DUF4178 domain-containing protein n=1 Tax=Baaleninema simplex TaxID=2862350 RepID=UPI00036E1560|nr:DUF4178 domain-containing protein [Baaleninema simplex]